MIVRWDLLRLKIRSPWVMVRKRGKWIRSLKKCGASYVRDSLVITRNPESQNVLGGLGISTKLGTDTAWTFEPHPPAYARKTLSDAGWDEKTPVLVLCPIHPFVWPVKASIARYLARVTTGAYKTSQYRTVYFHESGEEVDRKYKKYIDGTSKPRRHFNRKQPRLYYSRGDGTPRRRRLPRHRRANSGHADLTSDDYDMYQNRFDSASMLVHGFVALSWHRHLHAEPRRFCRRHHG